MSKTNKNQGKQPNKKVIGASVGGAIAAGVIVTLLIVFLMPSNLVVLTPVSRENFSEFPVGSTITGNGWTKLYPSGGDFTCKNVNGYHAAVMNTITGFAWQYDLATSTTATGAWILMTFKIPGNMTITPPTGVTSYVKGITIGIGNGNPSTSSFAAVVALENSTICYVSMTYSSPRLLPISRYHRDANNTVAFIISGGNTLDIFVNGVVYNNNGAHYPTFMPMSNGIRSIYMASSINTGNGAIVYYYMMIGQVGASW